MDNHLYNIIRILAEKGEGVWAYSKYKSDIEDCPECKAVFEKIMRDDEGHIEKLRELLKTHIK
jgi:rubrerythrin